MTQITLCNLLLCRSLSTEMSGCFSCKTCEVSWYDYDFFQILPRFIKNNGHVTALNGSPRPPMSTFVKSGMVEIITKSKIFAEKTLNAHTSDFVHCHFDQPFKKSLFFHVRQ